MAKAIVAEGVRAGAIAMRLHAGIGRDYRARQVFPSLCPPAQDEVSFEGAATFTVSRTVALAVLTDARVQHARVYDKYQRGTKKSYRHLIDSLEQELQPEEWEQARAAKRKSAAEDRERWLAKSEAEEATRRTDVMHAESANRRRPEVLSHVAGTNVVRLVARQPARTVEAGDGGKVLTFVPKHRGPAVDHDTVRELEALLRHAKLGHMNGLAWAASIPEGRGQPGKTMACDTVGAAARSPDLGSDLAFRLLHKAAAMQRGESVRH